MKKTKDIPITIKPEERDIPEMIQVLKANIYRSRGGPFVPDVSFTKGQIAYLIEILEQHMKKEEGHASTRSSK